MTNVWARKTGSSQLICSTVKSPFASVRMYELSSSAEQGSGKVVSQQVRAHVMARSGL